MKRTNILLGVCCGIFMLFASCEAEIPKTGEPNPNLSIYDLKNLYQDKPVLLTKGLMKQATSITGVVISNGEKGDVPAGKVILQGYKGKNISGIMLDLGAEAVNYSYGDSITVQVEGLTLNKKDGALEIAGVANSAVSKLGNNKKPLVSYQFSSVAEAVKELDKYEGSLIGLTSMFVVDPTVGKRYVDDLKLTDWFEEIAVNVPSNAPFANEEVNNLANYVFLLLKDKDGKAKFCLQNTVGVKALELEEHRPGQLYAGFPEDFTDRVGSSTNLNFETVLSQSKLPWRFKGAYTLSSGSFVFTNGGANGDRVGAMVTGGAGSYIELNKNLYYGASKVGVYLYPATASDVSPSSKLPIVVRIEYSKDSGLTWDVIDDGVINITQNSRYVENPLPVDLNGLVRFRVFLVSTGGGRLGVDYFRVYQK